MKIMKIATAVLLAAGLAASPAWAGRLDRKLVPADAAWLAHLDVEALLGSTIGKALLEEAGDLHGGLDGIEELNRELGIDLRTDLKSLTLFGGGGDPEDDAVSVAVTNARADVAVERLTAKESVETLDLDGQTVFVIPDGCGGETYVHVRRGKGVAQRLVLCSRSRDSMRRALAVVAGDAPSLTRQDAGILGTRPRSGSILFAAAGPLQDLQAIRPASEIFRLARGITIDLGETEDEMRGEATLFANDEEAAANMADVVQGMVALGHLLGDEDAELARWRDVLAGVNVSSRDAAITVRFRFDARTLMGGPEANPEPADEEPDDF